MGEAEMHIEKGDTPLDDVEGKHLDVLASAGGGSHEKAKELIIYRHALGHEARPLKQDLLETEGRGSETGNLLGSEHHRHCAVHAADLNHSSSSEWVGLREGDHNTHRPRKRFSGLLPLGTLDVMRESARLLRRQSDLLTTLTAVLICPISIIILTHILVTHKLTDWLAVRIEVSMLEGSAAIEFHTPHMKFIYQKLAEFWVTSVVSFPLTVTMDCLAKASVVYTVASTYAGLKVTFGDILHRVVPRIWIRLSMTYTFCCVLFLAWGVVVILGMGFLNGVFVALDLPSVVAFVLTCSIGVLCGGICFVGSILLNVATVACALEDLTGLKALVRTFFLIQGRMQVAAWSYIVPAGFTAFIALLFAYRVTDSNEYTEYNSSASWEGPLLVLMHSFVYLFYHIMSTVFYFTCPTFSSLENFDRRPESSAEFAVVSVVTK